MDPKLLLLLPGLASCPMTDAQPTLYTSVASPAPVRRRGELPELPEKDHPADGEGSRESPIYLGIGAYANNTNTSSRVVVDSSASGHYTSSSPQAMWLANRFPLITSTHDFDVESFVPTPLSTEMMKIAPDTMKHLTNPSTLRARRSFGRRRT
jgi:hypothetical protein